MSAAEVAQALADIPADADRVIVIYPTGKGGEYACRWAGISAEQAASCLYQMADFIVDQKIPPDPRWGTGKPRG
ncbi:MAG: hypothetical protein NDI84_08300 [Steroidobacteraceae bacterium]|nr:hypothetical protein [Steroidobacteraceae bacterium]